MIIHFFVGVTDRNSLSIDYYILDHGTGLSTFDFIDGMTC